jgi:glycerophosphoryl diester phosphodiesterase
VYPETKHPTFHENLKLRITDKLLDALTKAGWNNAESPVFVQSFEVSNLQYINTKSTVRLVQLLDAYDVNADGTMDMKAPYGQPYDFVVSGNANTYNYFVTDAGLDFVKMYADGIGPWKPYIVPVYKNEILKTNDLIERAHKKGLLVHAYTFRNESERLAVDYLNDPQAEYKKFYDLGIDGLFSDFPATAVAARK